MSDKMSSVSNSSKFSVKSQQVIAAQDEKIAMMRKLLAENGIDPDSIPPPGENMEVDDTTNAKKRMPSGSPEGKHWESTDSSSDSENDAGKMKDKNKGSGSWKLTNLKKKGRNEVKQPTKKERKRANRLAKAKENKLEAMKLEQSRAVRAGQVEQVEQVLRVMQTQIQSEQNINKPNTNTKESVNVNVRPVLAPAPALDPPSSPDSGPTQLYSHIAASAPSTSRKSNAVCNNDSPALPPVFKTPRPEGPYRDEIVIEIISMDNKEFNGTITPTEARKTIFEDVLGFKQDDLAGVKIGFNRGRIITFKLKQQFDVDKLFEWEKFSFERSVGKDVSSISCLIRGLKDPGKRKTTMSSARAAQSTTSQYFDDGTRLVRIIGCDYKLLESEITDWLTLFGEILSEITEEIYEDLDDPTSLKLPPVGNGNYLVTMKLKKDLPNWLPIYGRRVCIEYKGNRKQCNWCYGPHLRKFCKNEKMTLDEYATRFRLQHPTIPEQYYGRLAKFENLNGVKEDLISATLKPTEVITTNAPVSVTLTVPKISYRRESIPGSSWVKVTPAATVAKPGNAQATVPSNVASAQPTTLISLSRSVTENAVSNVLNVIKATFKQTEREVVTGLTVGNHRSSSASKGRGLNRHQSDQ